MSGARVLVVDNYDSFTYNLVQELAELGAEPTVVRNDAWTLDQVREFAPDGIVISPGPGTPERPSDVGISNDVIRELGPTIPTLGVCLGHQCIGYVFGARIVRAPELVHGKTSSIYHRGEGVLDGLPIPFEATRYHSLVVERASLPHELKVTAETGDEIVMAMRHRTMPIEGVQFHPESVLTAEGMDMLRNFLGRCAQPAAAG
ncbi:MAG TPA: aminodeoxychorismate/anthranilate synthase component II [Actinomycetota bacterium]|nr:aminodeoxychorismate/anthranilate synthase component II [Actinomycetota bacterium]